MPAKHPGWRDELTRPRAGCVTYAVRIESPSPTPAGLAPVDRPAGSAAQLRFRPAFFSIHRPAAAPSSSPQKAWPVRMSLVRSSRHTFISLHSLYDRDAIASWIGRSTRGATYVRQNCSAFTASSAAMSSSGCFGRSPQKRRSTKCTLMTSSPYSPVRT